MSVNTVAWALYHKYMYADVFKITEKLVRCHEQNINGLYLKGSEAMLYIVNDSQNVKLSGLCIFVEY